MCHKNTGGHSNYQHGEEGDDRVEDTRETTACNIEINQTTNTDIATTTSVTTREAPKTRKWVHNLSKTPLTEDQEKVLARGPNFAIVTKEPPVSEYISKIERMCQQLKQGKAEELRGETK